MSAHRTDMHRLQDLVRLHRLGHSAKKVARLLSMSPNTERKYRNALLAEHLLKGDPDDLPEMDVLKEAVLRQLPSKPPPQQLSTATPYKERILSLHQAGAGPKAIFDRLKLDHADDFEVSYAAGVGGDGQASAPCPCRGHAGRLLPKPTNPKRIRRMNR